MSEKKVMSDRYFHKSGEFGCTPQNPKIYIEAAKVFPSNYKTARDINKSYIVAFNLLYLLSKLFDSKDMYVFVTIMLSYQSNVQYIFRKHMCRLRDF